MYVFLESTALVIDEGSHDSNDVSMAATTDPDVPDPVAREESVSNESEAKVAEKVCFSWRDGQPNLGSTI